MSKRAEQKAMEAYPPTHSDGKRHAKRVQSESVDTHQPVRTIFQKGYELAEKDLGWHSVDESLPPIEEEVIVLTNRMHGKELPYVGCICFAHRPNPNGWDGKDFETGEVKHYDVVTYNGWNIPGVKYWMPCPKIPEE